MSVSEIGFLLSGLQVKRGADTFIFVHVKRSTSSDRDAMFLSNHVLVVLQHTVEIFKSVTN